MNVITDPSIRFNAMINFILACCPEPHRVQLASRLDRPIKKIEELHDLRIYASCHGRATLGFAIEYGYGDSTILAVRIGALKMRLRFDSIGKLEWISASFNLSKNENPFMDTFFFKAIDYKFVEGCEDEDGFDIEKHYSGITYYPKLIDIFDTMHTLSPESGFNKLLNVVVETE